jgi:hypothetical protein
MAEPVSITMTSQKHIHDIDKSGKSIYRKSCDRPKTVSMANAKRALVAPISPNKTHSRKVDIELAASPTMDLGSEETIGCCLQGTN